jgi:predicted transcriptional regulator
MTLDKYEESHEALGLDVRRRLYLLVKKNAGCHFRELERRSKMATGTLRHHLSFLVKKNLISERKEGNAVRYFPQGFPRENKKVLALLRQKSIRSIILYLLTHTTCNHESLVQETQLSPSTVSWHLKKLEQASVISAKKQGRKACLRLLIDQNELIKLLITYQESFFDSMVDNIIEMWC